MEALDKETVLMDLVRAYVLSDDDAFLEPRFFDGTREALAQLDQRLALVDTYHVKTLNQATLRKARSSEPSPAAVLNPLSVQQPMFIDMLEYYLYYGKMGRYYALVQALKEKGGNLYERITSAHRDRLDYVRGRNIAGAYEILEMVTEIQAGGAHPSKALPYIHGIMDAYDTEVDLLMRALEMCNVPSIRQIITFNMILFCVVRNRFDRLMPHANAFARFIRFKDMETAARYVLWYIELYETYNGRSLPGQTNLPGLFDMLFGHTQLRDHFFALPLDADEADLNRAIANATSGAMSVSEAEGLVYKCFMLPMTMARTRFIFGVCEPIVASLAPVALDHLRFLATYCSGLAIRWMPSVTPADRIAVLQNAQVRATSLGWLHHRSVDDYWTVLGEKGNAELQTMLPYAAGFSVAQWRDLLRRRRPDADGDVDSSYALDRFNDATNPVYAESDDVLEVLLDEWLRSDPSSIELVHLDNLSLRLLRRIFVQTSDVMHIERYLLFFSTYIESMVITYRADDGQEYVPLSEPIKNRPNTARRHTWRNFVWLIRFLVRLPRIKPMDAYHFVPSVEDLLASVDELVAVYPTHITWRLHQELSALRQSL